MFTGVSSFIFYRDQMPHWWVLLTSTFTGDSVHEHAKIKNQTPW